MPHFDRVDSATAAACDVTYVKREDDGAYQRVDTALVEAPDGVDDAPDNEDPDAGKADSAQEAKVPFAVGMVRGVLDMVDGMVLLVGRFTERVYVNDGPADGVVHLINHSTISLTFINQPSVPLKRKDIHHSTIPPFPLHSSIKSVHTSEA